MTNNNRILTKICEYCRLEFSARNKRAIYCSSLCSNRANKQKIKAKIKSEQNKQNIYLEIYPLTKKEYLSINNTAKLLGVSRSTIYRYINSGDLQASRIGKRLFIKRTEIESTYSSNTVKSSNYTTKPIISKRTEIDQFYTINEILGKYTISNSWFYTLAKRHKIDKTLSNGKTYYNKQQVDKMLGNKKVDDLINYMTAIEIANDYNMTIESTYTFTSREKIPSIKIKNTTYYSKKHVHIAKGEIKKLETDYYTTKEATKKYKLSRNALYNLIRYHNIPKIKNGKYIYIDKIALDQLF